MYRIRILFFFLFSLIAFPGHAQAELSPDASVTILTCEAGHEIYSLFGHTAIRITDPATSLDVVFNYGAFDFRTPNFALKFARGDLQYFVTAESYADFIVQYTMEQRDVYEQKLNLSYDQKAGLFRYLSETLASDQRFYTYKFIDRNCTNMAVDAINKVLGSRVIVKREIPDETYREIIFPYFKNHFFEQWGTSVLFGTKVDELATTLFLPSEFMHSLSVTSHQGKPIASRAQKILDTDPPDVPFSWWNNLWVYLAIMTVIVIFHKRKSVQTAYFTVLSILGLLFIWTMLYSLHEELRNNYNILLFNPLLVVLAILNEQRKRKSTCILAWTCLGITAIYLMILATKAHALIMLPIVLANVLILFRMIGINRK